MTTVFDLGTEYHCINGHINCKLPKTNGGHNHTRRIATGQVVVVVWFCDEHRAAVENASIEEIMLGAHHGLAYRVNQLDDLMDE